MSDERNTHETENTFIQSLRRKNLRKLMTVKMRR